MRSKQARAFSLVEVTIALGIVSFALVGLLGALPLAMGSERYSVEQTRATTIANTLFTTFRSQPFTSVTYLSGGLGTPVNLASESQAASPGSGNARNCYATFTDGAATGEGLQFQTTQGSAQFAVALGFNNMPGTTASNADPSGSTVPVAGMANQVEVAVYAIDHPKDIYRFISVIANRTR